MITLILTILSGVLLTLGSSILLAKASRMCGGGKPDLNYGLDQWLYAIPYGIAGFITGNWLGMIVSYFPAFLGKRLGHGEYFDLGTWTKKVTAEKIDVIVRFFFGKDPNTMADNVKGNVWRDWFGLSLTGLVCGLGLAGVLFFHGMWIWGTWILISSWAKGTAYIICRKYHDKIVHIYPKLGIALDDSKSETEPAEWLSGFFGGLGVFPLLYFILLTTFLF